MLSEFLPTFLNGKYYSISVETVWVTIYSKQHTIKLQRPQVLYGCSSVSKSPDFRVRGALVQHSTESGTNGHQRLPEHQDS